MDYGDLTDRKLAWVVVEPNLLRSGEEAELADSVAFVFQSAEGKDEFGPFVHCDLAAAAETTDSAMSQVQIAKAMEMVRRLASLNDEQVFEAWQKAVKSFGSA